LNDCTGTLAASKALLGEHVCDIKVKSNSVEASNMTWSAIPAIFDAEPNNHSRLLFPEESPHRKPEPVAPVYQVEVIDAQESSFVRALY